MLVCILTFTCFAGHSQTYSSKDNYTGIWDSQTTWNPEWPDPVYNIIGLNINIYGKITSRDSISFNGSDNILTIYDTLIVNGSLDLSNNSSLIVNDGAILLVIGNLRIDNRSSITANGLIVVTGDIIKKSSLLQGFFLSNDNPVEVFVFGMVYPAQVSDNLSNYEVLNCTSPVNIVYPSTNCTYGNYMDFLNSQDNSLFQQSLAELNTSYILPVCVGDTINLSSTTGKDYQWTGPDSFFSNEQNLVLPDADKSMSGEYIINITTIGNFTDTDTINVELLDYPLANPGPDQMLNFTFETSMEAELEGNETGLWTLQSGSAHIADSTSPTSFVSGLSLGENIFLWTVNNGACNASSELTITVESYFIPSVITPNGDGVNDLFIIEDVQMKVELIIFNRWGIIEYTNRDYDNNWDGKNNNGNDLPVDTYFYILNFTNNITLKGSILIQR